MGREPNWSRGTGSREYCAATVGKSAVALSFTTTSPGRKSSEPPELSEFAAPTGLSAPTLGIRPPPQTDKTKPGSRQNNNVNLRRTQLNLYLHTVQSSVRTRLLKITEDSLRIQIASRQKISRTSN